MPQKRSRPLTEQKFQNAVLQLVAEQGCSGIGVNNVAHLAGADKVLIYRYFGNIDGLLQRVAESRDWLPSVNELLSEVAEGRNGASALRTISNHLVREFRSDSTVSQLLTWRKAHPDPLTKHFAAQWDQLWHDLAKTLSEGSDYAARQNWQIACELCALIVEAEIGGKTIETQSLDRIAGDLSVGALPDTKATDESNSTAAEELPTNLL
ncbi:MAG: TetR/AcrR family transcriptional regulator [Coraliomargarita sp.]